MNDEIKPRLLLEVRGIARAEAQEAINNVHASKGEYTPGRDTMIAEGVGVFERLSEALGWADADLNDEGYNELRTLTAEAYADECERLKSNAAA
jgi:hypothetical protein